MTMPNIVPSKPIWMGECKAWAQQRAWWTIHTTACTPDQSNETVLYPKSVSGRRGEKKKDKRWYDGKKHEKAQRSRLKKRVIIKPTKQIFFYRENGITNESLLNRCRPTYWICGSWAERRFCAASEPSGAQHKSARHRRVMCAALMRAIQAREKSERVFFFDLFLNNNKRYNLQ